MADIEETEGNHGAVREWLGRAARAPRDKAWVADGVISDRWAPVSPSGTLDGFVWRTPDERLAAPTESAARSASAAPDRGDRRARSCASDHARARGDRAGARPEPAQRQPSFPRREPASSSIPHRCRPTTRALRSTSRNRAGSWLYANDG